MMLSHRLLTGMMLVPKSKCSVPGSFENETLLICIIYIQEKVHQSIPNADTGLPWCTWCWNSSLVYSFIIKLQVSGSSWWGCCRIEVKPEEIDQISDISRIPRISSFSEIKYHECKVGSLCEWGFPRVWRWNVRRLMFLACSNAP